MWVQLGLHHPQLRLVEFPLAGHGAHQVLPVFLCHAVKAFRKTPQLVLTVRFHMDLQISLLDLPHSLVQLVNRLGQVAAQEPGAPEAEQQAHKPHQDADRVEGIHDLGAEGFRLL